MLISLPTLFEFPLRTLHLTETRWVIVLDLVRVLFILNSFVLFFFLAEEACGGASSVENCALEADSQGRTTQGAFKKFFFFLLLLFSVTRNQTCQIGMRIKTSVGFIDIKIKIV